MQKQSMSIKSQVNSTLLDPLYGTSGFGNLRPFLLPILLNRRDRHKPKGTLEMYNSLKTSFI